MARVLVQKKAVSNDLMTATERKEVREFRKAAREYAKIATRSRKAALQSLVDAGIFTPNGNPRKKYR
jgi:hypothetical protein